MGRAALWVVLVLAGPGLATAVTAPQYVTSWTTADLCSPRGAAVGPDGSVYAGSDCLTPNIERFSPAGVLLDEWGSLGSAPGQFIGIPQGIAVDAAGNVFASDDNGGNRIEKFTASGTFLLMWGSTGTTVGHFRHPVDVAVDVAGFVYVLDETNHNVQKFTGSGQFQLAFGTSGSGPGQFIDPFGLCVDAAGRIFVADGTRHVVIRFSPTGQFQREFPAGTEPSDATIGSDGNVYVPDAAEGTIRVFTPDGVPVLSFGGGFVSTPWRIAISPTGAIYVTDQRTYQVVKFQSSTVVNAPPVSFGRLKTLYR